MGKIITVPFNWLLMTLYDFVGNYGLAIILFALIVKLILLPFQMKSKRSMMRTSSLAPKLKELEKKFGDNKQKYQEEVAKIYKEEGIKPMSGCLWSLIPFPILIALYSVIRQPLTHAMGLAAEQITTVTNKLVALGVYTIPEKVDAYSQITLAELIHSHLPQVQAVVPQVVDIDYSFLGLNLGLRPSFKFWQFDWSDPAVWLPAMGLLLIPVISALLSWLQMKVSNKMNASAATDQGAQQMKGMMLVMPLVSLYIGFIMPAALGVYWLAQSVFGIVQEIVLNKHYGKIIAAEEAERNERFRKREEELERKRQETERLRAEGKTQVNANTSKKKLQAKERNREEERRAAEAREERRAKRVAMGLPPEEEKPASQVGNRRYARGRAYVADRYTNPETAEELTRLAAEESEGADAIDETVPDDVAFPESADAGETISVETPETEEAAFGTEPKAAISSPAEPEPEDEAADEASDETEEPEEADEDEEPWDADDADDADENDNGK